MTARSSSLRENTRRHAVSRIRELDGHVDRSAWLLGYILGAADVRSADELRAVVLGIGDAYTDLNVPGPGPVGDGSSSVLSVCRECDGGTVMLTQIDGTRAALPCGWCGGAGHVLLPPGGAA